MDTHYETHTSTFRAVVGRPPMALDPTAARNFLITPLEAMMNEDVQALVLIIYFVANILVLYHVHRSRFLESGD